MKKPIFFMMPFTLGTPNAPYRKGEKYQYGSKPLDLGAMFGPEKILYTNEFLENYFPKPLVWFPREEHYKFLAGKKVNLEMLGEFYGILTQEIAQLMSKKNKYTQVIIGGDHSIASPGLAAILERENPEDIGIVMIDSHGDIHNTKTCPSRNFHGMWIRAHLERFYVPSIEAYTHKKILPSNILYLGNLILEDEEEEYIARKKIQVISKLNLTEDPFNARKKIIQFTRKFSHIHLSIDIDAMDKKYACGTGLPVENGLFPKHILPALNYATTRPRLSIDMVEVYPSRDIKGKTVKLAQEILHRALR